MADVETQSPLDEWVHRLFPAYPAPMRTHPQLWLIDLKSGVVEEIAHLRISGPRPDTPELLDTYTLQWLPDGRKISFVYGEDLYAIDVP